MKPLDIPYPSWLEVWGIEPTTFRVSDAHLTFAPSPPQRLKIKEDQYSRTKNLTITIAYFYSYESHCKSQKGIKVKNKNTELGWSKTTKKGILL